MLELENKIMFKKDDFKKNGDIKASSLMYVFQEIAAAHAEELGLGFDKMIVQNYIWVLSKLRFKVLKKIICGDEYVIKTYPRPRKGIIFYRDYYICDKYGKSVCVATSHWCIINYFTRKIEKNKIEFDGDYISYPAFKDDIKKIKSKEMICAGIHKVGIEDMDKNNHVNNCRYGYMIDKVLGEKSCREYNIYFAKEAGMGDEILLYIEESENSNIVAGRLREGTELFKALVV